MKTKIKNSIKYEIKNKKDKNMYILPLALDLKERLENEDIELCISILNSSEKELLKKELLSLKIEVKNPADYKINRKIYYIISVIMDKTLINQRKYKQKPFERWTSLPLNN